MLYDFETMLFFIRICFYLTVCLSFLTNKHVQNFTDLTIVVTKIIKVSKNLTRLWQTNFPSKIRLVLTFLLHDVSGVSFFTGHSVVRGLDRKSQEHEENINEAIYS